MAQPIRRRREKHKSDGLGQVLLVRHEQRHEQGSWDEVHELSRPEIGSHKPNQQP